MTDKNSKPLRVVFLYSSGHFGSTVILNHLIKKNPNVEIVGLVRAPALPTFKKLVRHYFKLGWRFSGLLLWQRFIQGFALLLSGISPLSRQRLTPGWLLCLKHRIPNLRCKNVNNEQAVEFIKSCKPDIIVSAYFNQILKEPVLSIPKIGCLNIHPGYLPTCRGAMNYFWVLANNMKHAGVSIHWMDTGIDTGPIIARKRFTMRPDITQQQVMVYTAVVGARLLRRIFTHITNNKEIAPIQTDSEQNIYFAVPDKQDFHRYIRHRRFFRFRDITKFVFREIR